MKKTGITSIAIVALVFNTQAQLVKFGLKAGVNYANATAAEVTIDKQNYQTAAIGSYHAGIVARVKLTDKFAVQPELIYTTEGASYKNAATQFKNELGYLSIPLLAQLTIGNVFILEAGPQAHFLVSQKNNFDLEDYNTFEFAAAAGLGVQLTKSVFVQGRYVMGVTDPSKNSDIKSATVQLSAGFFF
ncbi:porin family protein [Flavobacterium crassostreae]|uniref:Outer membrane protein beta-barrel domain-containing protein n=1 Tax=Flavobacterium crassostreae TaxID=1763534 RepID=A0A1B9E7T6_9FLAO|nr:porin family protein [Flavobacterium crassostreae]OCB77928.1 hypothetical protein LPBF_02985 [Flavobacterium crassostreae]